MDVNSMQAWIVAGRIDGAATDGMPLLADSAGVPHLLRLAMEAALIGCRTITVFWHGDSPLPNIEAVASHKALASRASISIVKATALADGSFVLPSATTVVAVMRADRMFHRDVPRAALNAWQRATDVNLGKVDGDEFDCIVIARPALAAKLVGALAEAGQWTHVLRSEQAADKVASGSVPYLGFCKPVLSLEDSKRLERTLVSSLRKSADGIAAKAVNRSISLPMSYLMRHTSITPNQITVMAFLSALVGGILMGALDGYWIGVAGMFLVEWGSIIDGCDGEIARLKYLFSRLGQWMDTLADDFANVAYVSGITLHLDRAGVTWAVPLGVSALIAFALTQSSQYWLIVRVYKSGDLAAIPWAFQSSDFLSQQPKGALAFIKATVPKLLKRDFAVSMFFLFAVLGHLEWVLVGFSAGALSFFVVFFVQFARNLSDVRRTLAAQSKR